MLCETTNRKEGGERERKNELVHFASPILVNAASAAMELASQQDYVDNVRR